MLSQRLIQQVEQERNWEIYRVLLMLEEAQLMDKGMIMQVSLSFQRMNVSLFWFEMNILCSRVK